MMRTARTQQTTPPPPLSPQNSPLGHNRRIYKSNQRASKRKATVTSTTTADDLNRSTASHHLRPISLNNDLTNIVNNSKLHCMPGYDLIPNSPESATLYDDNSLISTRPDSLENMLFDTNKKIAFDDNYCVMNELEYFGNEENRNLQIGIDDMYHQITDIDDPKLIKATFVDDGGKLNHDHTKYPYELENLHEILSVDANLNSASRSYLKETTMNMMHGGQHSYYDGQLNGTICNAIAIATANATTTATTTTTTTHSNQLISNNNSNKTMHSTNKQFNAIDTTNQYLVKMPSNSANEMMIGKMMTTPIGINMNFQDDFDVVGNDFDMGFGLNGYDIDEAASSSSGSHLAFACTDPNILSDIPSRYLTTFNNIQNETI